MGELDDGARKERGDQGVARMSAGPAAPATPATVEPSAAPSPSVAPSPSAGGSPRPPVAPPGGDLDDPILGDLLVDTGLQELLTAGVAESQRLAAEYRRLAGFWRQLELPQGGDPSGADEYEAETLAVALALRCTRATAYHRINDAHRALTALPCCFARLASGEFPCEWFQRLLRRTRHLTATDLTALDQSIATWPLGQLTVEQYRRRLSHALTRITAQRQTPPQHTPEGRRRVDLLPVGEDGIGCLQVIGPIPEILTLAQRLDASARAIQHTQRHALGAGEPPPLDPDGTVTTHGKPLSLARLRYELLTGASLDTDGVKVPRERFRLAVTVPALTLLGASEEPGTLDGTIPIPAVMARELAGQCETWHRVLTDPATGAFLPLPAKAYRPTTRMLEHLRLRHATCAAPGCTRPSSWAAECDHIQEYDHTDPTRGGLTEIDNLHLLCWMHHRLKTAGLIDPARHTTTPRRPGVTAWEIHARAKIAVQDDTDLATPTTVAELTTAWQTFERDREQRALRAHHNQPTTPDQQRPPPPEDPPF